MAFLLENIKNSPLKNIDRCYVTSKFGFRSFYNSKTSRYENNFHYGIDLISGTEVVATATGKVVNMRNSIQGYSETYDKCKSYLSELYPIFNKVLIIDNMLDEEEIDAMLMGFNELYNDIKLEPLEDVEMSIKK